MKIKQIILLSMVLAVFCVLMTFAAGSQESSKSSEGTTITYWTFLDPTDSGPRSAVQQFAIDKFEKSHPDVKVKVEVLQWDKISSNLITSAKAKQAPDLTRIFQPDFAQNVAAGTLEPLNDYIADWSQEQKSDWVIPWNATVADGNKYGFFWDTRVRHMWYRGDLLKESGLAVPDSLHGMAETAQKIQTDQVTGVMVTVSRKYATSFGEWFLPTLYGAGGKLINSDGTAAFNDNAGERVFQWVDDLVNEYEVMPKGAPSLSYEDMYQGFLAGTVGFFNSGSHRVAEGRADSGLNEKLQTAPWPGFNAGTPSPAWTTGWIMVIGRHAEHKDLAWELMMSFLDPETQLQSAKLAKEMPARKSVLEDPWFSTAEAAEMQSWLKYAADYPFDVQMPEKWALLVDSLAIGVDEMLTRSVSAKEALNEAAERYNQGM